MRVAIVWNHDHTGVINRFGQPCQEEYRRETAESVLAALQEGGHETLLCEGDKGLLATLERFMSPDPQAIPSGMVFNMAVGIQGECRQSHVPAMLEMAGIPYTGSGPLGHALALDKVITKRLIRESGVPTPNFRVMRRGTESPGDLRFPVVVKPRHESDTCGVQLVDEPAQLEHAVEVIVTQFAQDALVEEYIEGREVTIALLGNEGTEVLPIIEYDFGEREIRHLTRETTTRMICPAQIESNLAMILRDISVATFRACQCRDYARVDLRIDRSGRPFVLEINSIPALCPSSADPLGTSCLPLAAMSAGYSFSSLVNRMLEIAHARYFGPGIV
ncbi:conserved hypothetical protein [Mesorhizobium prunaredense]|uniref:ATP-grasp domain-containing protein n=1 Tax=Mesorhizobium prunaredense TaxID=1631249 RepID=A0A1R3V8G9_9HYPH|nr:ATP-grasp domain-containing protein [Mesorhizobium prunaredense]SIT54665.1 conserved hypothetical protein [Mesorhizobium prunaredense]